ncbi:hybrid sensor histidine kinase/response regulator transcription factor [Dinghuibacter silviterrae]|uniref:hybrid sensor histidine kinase/response regulator transcription factor n=1 Tax=Dinghuibacter silviterrae TaxID=1539049 RepID=UPI001B88578F|nr:two-component regulator propeller domain-containing protein [Dinghuibacter silviterrae]
MRFPLWVAFFLPASFLLAGRCFGQAPSLPFRHIGYEQGLSNSTIECIFQDSHGFIWLGTRDGLNRYDGNDMTVYRNRAGDNGSLSDDYVRCITEDAAHTLWIGTSNGLNRFDPSTQTFTRYPAGAINALAADSSGGLWVGTDGGGLYYGGKGLVRVPTFGAHINALSLRPEGTLWIGSEVGLSRMGVGGSAMGADGSAIGTGRSAMGAGGAPPRDEVIHATGAPLPPVLVIRADASGDLWLGTAEDGVWVYHVPADAGRQSADAGKAKASAGKATADAGEATANAANLVRYRHEDKTPSSLGGNMIKSILVDREGRAWVGCINGGLNLFEASTEHFFHYQNDPLDASSLSQRTVSAIFEDNQGNLWVGTHRGGLNVYMPGAAKFRKYPSREGAAGGTTADGLTNSDVRAFFEDAKGDIWIGTDGGGLNVWSRRANRWQAYRYNPYDPKSLGSDAVLDVTEDKSGRRWVSTWEGGLNLFHPETGTFTRYLHREGDTTSISSNYVQKTFEDRKGRLWVGTYFGGLNLLDPGRGTFRRVRGDEAGETQVQGNNVVSLGEDAGGNLWAGTDDGGLNRCDLRTGRWSHYFTHEGKMPDIRVIFTDHRGRLWIGRSGLFLYDAAKDTFSCYTDKAGLSHEFIKGIIEDGLGNFWISTGGGLTCFNPDTYAFTRYNRGDGLQGLEFEPGAYLETRAGEMLFGGTNGFNAFFPRDIQRNPYIPPVYITGFQVGGQRVDAKDTLRLGFRESTFSFTFTALNYSVPENNQYAYMLEGFDKDWHYVGNEHKANYTNLDPGTYVLRVKASNNDGVWNEQGARVLIVIAPPFWKTWWFAALVALAVTGGAYTYYRFKRSLELAKLEEKKREEIHQVQLQFFTNISHELRTPLTLILGQVEKLYKMEVSPTLTHYYASIRRNATRLMGLINELMDFRKLETGTLSLHVMPGRLDLFLDEIADEFKDWAAEKNIRFKVETGQAAPAWFDRQVLEKIVLNLLHNAFKYTDAGGEITLKALPGLDGFTPSFAHELVLRSDRRAKRYQYIRVADTGIGISKESIAHLFERYYRISESHLGSGVGLAFVRSLTQLHKGDIFVYSERYKGTEIIVGIPSEEEEYTAAERWAVGLPAGRVQLESIRTAGVDQELAPQAGVAAVGGAAAGGVAASGADAPGEAAEGALPQDAEGTPGEEAPLVLIVEDNTELRDFLKETFAPFYRVDTAGDGEEGWARIREDAPDLIVSDVMMPKMDGVALCRLVKQDLGTSHIPFLMLTAKNTGSAQLEGVESGADHYFTKPLSMDLLLATVRNIFQRQQKLRDRYQRDYQVQARELVHSQKDKAFMDALLETIEAQLVNPDLDVEYLCSQLGMSRTRLYQKIKQITGQSIGEFVRTIRLKRAVHILLHEDVPFTEVMYRIGIQSQSYFTKAFKKEFGKTPTQFLQDVKKGS